MRDRSGLPEPIYENFAYYCPKCGVKLSYIYNFFSNEDHDYILQCPNDRFHCKRKTMVDQTTIFTGFYNAINIMRCSQCDSVLRYDAKNNVLRCDNKNHTDTFPPINNDIIDYLPFDDI
jgi:hypothetical protein